MTFHFFRRLSIIFSLFFYPVSFVHGQIAPGAIGYYQDALRFSAPTVPVGSARIQALGGAQTALGGDISNATGNPAGLGFFQTSEVSLSLGLNLYATSSNYIGTSTSDSKFNLTIPNLGIVIASPADKYTYSSWKGGSFGISYTRTNNFQNNITYSGVNNLSTLADNFVENAEGIDANIFEFEAANNEILDATSAAYAAFIISPFIDDSTFYFTEFRDINDALVGGILQENIIRTEGNTGQWSFSYGGNFSDRFYFGATLGITSLNYTYSRSYRETLQVPANDLELQSFSFDEELRMTGNGINFTLGLIGKPVDWLNIGVTATTPTLYNIQEDQSIIVTGNSVGFSPVSAEVLPLEYSFTLQTPLRVAGGATAFIGKKGFLTGEIEYITYDNMSVEGDGDDLAADDETIRNFYDPVLNFRGGAEYRNGILRLRAGAAYLQSPISEDIDGLNRDILTLSGGVGIRLPQGYVDFTLSNTIYQSVDNPYTLSNGAFFSATTDNAIWAGLFTFGFNF